MPQPVPPYLNARSYCWNPLNPAGQLAAFFDLRGGPGRQLPRKRSMQKPTLPCSFLHWQLPACLPLSCPLAGVTMKNLQLGAVRAVFAALERHYPERVSAIYMCARPPAAYTRRGASCVLRRADWRCLLPLPPTAAPQV